jgi:hypothetical protein
MEGVDQLGQLSLPRRAGIASEVIVTRSPTQTLESRVKSRLGRGLIKKSSGR